MRFTWFAVLTAVALFVSMLLLMRVGRRVGARKLAIDPEGAHAGTGPIDAAVFGLMGLLLAFTFSSAASRFDTRRELIVEETNAIGTAYLRLDLLPASARAALRDLFRRYLDARLAAYAMLPDLEAAEAELARATSLQREIWDRAVAAGQAEGVPTTTSMLLLPALNQMIDITTTRTMAGKIHPPAVIIVMLFGLELACALLAGYSIARSKSRQWLHTIGFAATMTFAVYVIIDIEYPRLGLIRVDAFDQALVSLRESMNR